jgi:hypothetical protein
MIDILCVCVYENHKAHKILSEWMSDCCLTPVEQFFSCIMARTSYISMRWWCLLCTRPTDLVGLLIVLAHWNNSPRVDMWCSTKTHNSNSEPINLCPYSLIWCAKRKDANTNLIVWFGLTWPGLKSMIYHTWGEDRNHNNNLTYPVYDYKLIPPLQPWRLQVPRKDKSASL